MTLKLPLEESPLNQVYVAIDLETTGTTPAQDEVIEVGAVKFRGHEILARYSALVNPYRALSPFIKHLTGITQEQVDGALPFAVVGAELDDFIGDCPIIGHNVSFDLAFLSARGLRFSGIHYDTRDLAYILLQRESYSLGNLASSLGIEHPTPHRALPDALTTSRVFTSLLEKAMELGLSTLGEIGRLAGLAQWPLSRLLRGLEEEKARGISPEGRRSLAVGGVDLSSVERRLGRHRTLDIKALEAHIDQEEVVELLKEGGHISQVLEGYQYRKEQEEMLGAVVQAFNDREKLTVEAGTGVGKTLAYLLPAALFALKNHCRVVISTGTISLQEQLIKKDLPLVMKILEGAVFDAAEELKFTVLKGRDNYLCLKRWSHLRSASSLPVAEARFLAKTVLWLNGTSSGDRAELSVSPRDSLLWSRLSAQGAKGCPRRDMPCFLRTARERAEEAHVVVVNHALLLSNLASGGGLIPSHDYLVLDEAHHLEEEATRHFGFCLIQDEVEEHLQLMTGNRGLGQEVLNAYRSSIKAQSSDPTQRSQGTVKAPRPSGLEGRQEDTMKLVKELEKSTGRAIGNSESFFAQVARFLADHALEKNGFERQLRVTPSVRAQPGWSQLEVAWENMDIAALGIARGLEGVMNSLNGLSDELLKGYQDLCQEMESQLELNSRLREEMKTFFVQPQPGFVYWLSQDSRGGIGLNGAPLDVAPLLKEHLFDEKESVILTGATLASGGGFKSFHDRIGLEGGRELILGSPFNYPKAALLCLPRDMPEPDNRDYSSRLAQSVIDLARAAQGRTMVLFTSNSSLLATRTAISGALERQDIQVLAQGADGPPRQLIEDFQKNPKTVLLGTNSFWEGVDLPGGVLKLLVIAKLPFDVPTEPLFAARSDLFENPFYEYALPRAVLRFRQGFGRIIRSHRDHGAIVLLDGRINSKSYGKALIDSLPPCTTMVLNLAEIPQQIAKWING